MSDSGDVIGGEEVALANDSADPAVDAVDVTVDRDDAMVETVRAHSNSYGEKFEKAIGAVYAVADPLARQSLLNSGLVQQPGSAPLPEQAPAPLSAAGGKRRTKKPANA